MNASMYDELITVGNMWEPLGQEWCQRREGAKYAETALTMQIRFSTISADLVLCEVRRNRVTGVVQRRAIPITELNYADE